MEIMAPDISLIEEIDKIVKKENATNHLWVADGLNFISNANASPYSAGFIRLKDIDKRGDMKDPDQIAAALTGKVSAVKDANAFFFNFPTVQGFGNVSGFEFMLQDRTNGSFEQLGTTTQAFIGELMKRKEIAFAFTTYAAGNPQYTIEVDSEKAKQLGVSITELMQTGLLPEEAGSLLWILCFVRLLKHCPDRFPA